MKKIFYTFFILMFIVTGCGEDFLNLLPETNVVSETFYVTETDFTQAVNASYAPLQPIFKSQFWSIAEMRSDNTSYQHNTSDASGFARNEIDEFREQDDNSELAAFFNNSFIGIARCNVILDKIGTATLSEEFKNKTRGQVLFLRGMYYFNLVRVFGDVPLILKEIKSLSEAYTNATRATPTEVYQQIKTDLDAAAGLLPASYTAAGDKGRATKGAALTFLAKVHMTLGNYNDAVPLLRTVKTLGYDLMPSYADNYDITKENNIESIFEVQYFSSTSVDEASDFAYVFAPWNSAKDIVTPGVYSGSASGWNLPTQNMLDAYETGDLRKDISIGTYVKDAATIYYVKKYTTATTVQGKTDSNWPVIRYADVLLMLAECLNEAGYVADGEAFDLLNEVRDRAGLADKTSNNADVALRVATQDEFRAAIAQERRVELAFENHRWFDLVRTGKAEAVMLAHGTAEKALKAYVLGSSYTTIRLVYQYPRREALLLSN